MYEQNIIPVGAPQPSAPQPYLYNQPAVYPMAQQSYMSIPPVPAPQPSQSDGMAQQGQQTPAETGAGEQGGQVPEPGAAEASVSQPTVEGSADTAFLQQQIAALQQQNAAYQQQQIAALQQQNAAYQQQIAAMVARGQVYGSTPQQPTAPAQYAPYPQQVAPGEGYIRLADLDFRPDKKE